MSSTNITSIEPQHQHQHQQHEHEHEHQRKKIKRERDDPGASCLTTTAPKKHAPQIIQAVAAESTVVAPPQSTQGAVSSKNKAIATRRTTTTSPEQLLMSQNQSPTQPPIALAGGASQDIKQEPQQPQQAQAPPAQAASAPQAPQSAAQAAQQSTPTQPHGSPYQQSAPGAQSSQQPSAGQTPQQQSQPSPSVAQPQYLPSLMGQPRQQPQQQQQQQQQQRGHIKTGSGSMGTMDDLQSMYSNRQSFGGGYGYDPTMGATTTMQPRGSQSQQTMPYFYSHNPYQQQYSTEDQTGATAGYYDQPPQGASGGAGAGGTAQGSGAANGSNAEWMQDASSNGNNPATAAAVAAATGMYPPHSSASLPYPYAGTMAQQDHMAQQMRTASGAGTAGGGAMGYIPATQPGMMRYDIANNPIPQLVRTTALSQAASSLGSNAVGMHPQHHGEALTPQFRASLELVTGQLESMVQHWTPEEWHAKRRLVQFTRAQRGAVISAEFFPLQASKYTANTPCISCIYWEERQDWYVTSVDCIYLLEQLVNAKFTVEEKNRIRRNLEGYHPLTVSKGKAESGNFFRLIMSFSAPKPRNIEKDVKVFPWKILSQALKKIISKYSADYGHAATAAAQVGAIPPPGTHYMNPRQQGMAPLPPQGGMGMPPPQQQQQPQQHQQAPPGASPSLTGHQMSPSASAYGYRPM
ncbi:hypothetical protein TRVA0_005S01354 [Trichomonascus vanleenenianus]|uniref:uncharacterized protein n=1 Tax=Trichomonascus vanleenenianus TaxID=2268995 RepID=UPI003ECAE54B